MGKKSIMLFASFLAAVMLTACGKYDFSDKELTGSIGVKKSVFDSMDISPDDDGETGNALMEQAKAMGGADMYTYWFPEGDGYDIVELFFYGGKVSSVTLMSFGNDKSGYTVLGIHAGDSKAAAVSKAEAYFGEGFTSMSDNTELWGLTDRETDYIYFGGNKNRKGSLTLKVDVKSDTVISAEYEKL